tara:strand:- start:76 stop:1071 length:996 start_codon:yes stop_codon:yes gene_type:complete
LKAVIFFYIFLFLSIVFSCNGGRNNEPPIARFSYSPQTPFSGETVTFDASASFDPDGQVSTYHWQIGEDTIHDSVTFTWSFSSEGTYEIALVVMDNDGDKGQVVNVLTIGSALIPIYSFSLDLLSPSGLTFSSDLRSLWTLSDKPGGLIYHVSLKGAIISSLSYNGSDMEGITRNNSDNTFWVVEESSGELVNLDSSGSEIERVYVSGSYEGDGGLEGIALNETNGHIYLLKEKDPGILIELDHEFNMLQFNSLFFAQDFSGIWYDQTYNQLWIVSDQEKTVFKCDTTGAVLKSYSIQNEKMEGIAADIENKRVYLVNDVNDKLYIYELME